MALRRYYLLKVFCALKILPATLSRGASHFYLLTGPGEHFA